MTTKRGNKMLTNNPVKDAESYQMQLDRIHEAQANDYSERVTANMNDLETFKEFLAYIDVDAPEVQAFHGCMDEDKESKLFAYDTFMMMFEEYVHEITEL